MTGRWRGRSTWSPPPSATARSSPPSRTSRERSGEEDPLGDIAAADSQAPVQGQRRPLRGARGSRRRRHRAEQRRRRPLGYPRRRAVRRRDLLRLVALARADPAGGGAGVSVARPKVGAWRRALPGATASKLGLAPVGEAMFPSRTPFFQRPFLRGEPPG